ncbi:UNVERIFIED_CONTAM: hypothetical protein FKN15_076627 [Acipenser sinensis]
MRDAISMETSRQLNFVRRERCLRKGHFQFVFLKFCIYSTVHVYESIDFLSKLELLEECTMKLNLNTAARRVFLLSGEEAHEPKDIPHDAEVYISTGEPFVDPFKKIKDHLTLSKEANWTVNGVVLPADAKRGTTKPNLSLRMRKLSEKTTVRILVFKNGAGQDGCEVIAAVDQTEKLLQIVGQRLQSSQMYNPSGLNLFPTRLFDEQGQEICNPCSLQNEQKVWVSYGEDYRSTYNPVLSLTFDRVTAVVEKDNRVVYKTLLDPDADLPTGLEK